MAQPNPFGVSAFVDLLEQNPGAEMEIPETAPAGFAEAVVNEIDRRNLMKRLRQPQKPSMTKSAAFGGAQGYLLGHADELAGAIAAPFEGTKTPLAQTMEEEGTDTSGLSPELGMYGPNEQYRMARNDFREQERQAAKENPGAYTGAMIAGGVANPVKLPPAAIGAVAGAGMAEDVQSVPLHATEGALMGKWLGAAGKRLGQAGQKMAGTIASRSDDILAGALEMDPRELAMARQSGAIDDILGPVKKHAEFPYGSQRTAENIDAPWSAIDAEGSVANPGLTTAQKIARAEKLGPGVPSMAQRKIPAQPPGREIDLSWPESMPTNADDAALLSVHGEQSPWMKASPDDISGIDKAHAHADQLLAPKGAVPNSPKSSGFSPPQQPIQMPAGDQKARDLLFDVAKSHGGGILPKTGLTPSTFKGGIGSAIMAKSGMLAGVGGNRLATKMKDIIGRGDQAAGMSRALSGKMMQLIDAVFQSNDVDLEDYLAQEMSAQYKALRMEAQNELEKEENQ